MGQRSSHGLVVKTMMMTSLSPLQVDSTSTTGLVTSAEEREVTSPTMSRIREEFSRSFIQRQGTEGEREKKQ